MGQNRINEFIFPYGIPHLILLMIEKILLTYCCDDTERVKKRSGKCPTICCILLPFVSKPNNFFNYLILEFRQFNVNYVLPHVFFNNYTTSFVPQLFCCLISDSCNFFKTVIKTILFQRYKHEWASNCVANNQTDDADVAEHKCNKLAKEFLAFVSPCSSPSVGWARASLHWLVLLYNWLFPTYSQKHSWAPLLVIFLSNQQIWIAIIISRNNENNESPRFSLDMF